MRKVPVRIFTAQKRVLGFCCHCKILQTSRNTCFFCFRCLIECREEYRYNLDAVEALIRAHLVNMQQYDLHLAQAMENGLNYMTVHFAMQLVQRFCIDDKHGSQISEADFYNTIETLSRIATHSRQAPEGWV